MEEMLLSEYESNRTGGDGKGSGRVKPQDMELMQDKLFETLAYFADFCEQHDLRYILAGGTCIGAVRHHDLVPWDGDVDVALLREDFNKLFELWEEYGDKENFSLYRTTENFCAHVSIGLLRNNNTTFIRDFEKDVTDTILGVKIDIEPFDEVPEGKIKRQIQKYNSYLRSVLFTQRKMRRKKANGWMKRAGVSAILWLFRNKSLRNKMMKITDYQVQKYNGSGSTVVALNGGADRFDRSIFTDRVKMDVRGKEMYIPAQYDSYLRVYYNDYMQKPPVEMRRFGDNPAYYDLNMPYKEYLASCTNKEAERDAD